MCVGKYTRECLPSLPAIENRGSSPENTFVLQINVMPMYKVVVAIPVRAALFSKMLCLLPPAVAYPWACPGSPLNN